MKYLIMGASLLGAVAFLAACGGGYVGGGSVDVVGGDYYGPDYGGAVFYGHPGYREDSHVVSPPRQAWHGGGGEGGRSAPAQHSAPSGGGDRDHK